MRQGDGSLALVADLQRLSRAQELQQLLGRITRRYAAEIALREASTLCAETQVSMST